MLFAEDLTKVTWECVHFVRAEPEAALLDRLSHEGVAVFRVDGSQVSTKHRLLPALAKEMGFPDYFGENWDAVDECLRDMSWKPAKGYVLFFIHAEQFWRRAAPLGGELVESWLFAAEEWSHENKPFHLVFVW